MAPYYGVLPVASAAPQVLGPSLAWSGRLLARPTQTEDFWLECQRRFERRTPWHVLEHIYQHRGRTLNFSEAVFRLEPVLRAENFVAGFIFLSHTLEGIFKTYRSVGHDCFGR